MDTANGDDDYARAWGGSPEETFYVHMDDPDAGVLDSATIDSIIIYARAKIILTDSTTTSGNICLGYRTASGSATTSGVYPVLNSGAYNLVGTIVSTTDSDGGALDVTDIEDLELYVKRTTGNGFYQLRVTELWVEVGYTP